MTTTSFFWPSESYVFSTVHPFPLTPESFRRELPTEDDTVWGVDGVTTPEPVPDPSAFLRGGMANTPSGLGSAGGD